MKNLKTQILITSVLAPQFALADFQSSLQGLLNSVISGVFPLVIMYELGKAGLAYARRTPDAKEKAEAAAIGAIAVLGINGVWTFIKSQVR